MDKLVGFLWQGFGPVLVYVLPIFIIVFFSILFSKITSWYKWQSRRCLHGIKGGRTDGEFIGRCAQCQEEEKLQVLRQAEWAKKSRIAKEAESLRNKEFGRLQSLLFPNKKYLLSLSSRDFEDAIAKMFNRLGYEVTQTPYSGDFGKDAVAMRNGIKYVIECKRYGEDKTIGRPHLQKFFAAMKEERAKMGFFVATCNFTSTATEYAKKYNMELIDIERLLLLMHQAYPNASPQISVKAMCYECGDTVEFPLLRNQFQKSCRNGHIVKNSFAEWIG